MMLVSLFCRLYIGILVLVALAVFLAHLFQVNNNKMPIPKKTCCIDFSSNSLHNSFWQNVTFQSGRNQVKTIYHKFYIDWRKNEIRTFLLTFGEYPLPSVYCVISDTSTGYFSKIPAEELDLTISTYVVRGVKYVSYLIICPWSKDANKYLYASLSYSQEEYSLTNKAEVIVPPAPGHHGEKLCLCLAAQYDRVGDVNVPFFIQWMELLHKFGVSKVVFYNATVRMTGVKYK
jgi:hypothetical protein